MNQSSCFCCFWIQLQLGSGRRNPPPLFRLDWKLLICRLVHLWVSGCIYLSCSWMVLSVWLWLRQGWESGRDWETRASVGLTVQTSQSLLMRRLPGMPETAPAQRFHTPTCHILRLPDTHFANKMLKLSHTHTHTFVHRRTHSFIQYCKKWIKRASLRARLWHVGVCCAERWPITPRLHPRWEVQQSELNPTMNQKECGASLPSLV